jgi:hypothetical protein
MTRLVSLGYLPDRNPIYADALENVKRYRRKAPEEVKQITNEEETAIISKCRDDPLWLSDLARLVLRWCPNLWFLVVQKRCPGCGQNAIPVGSNLRIPVKKDKKGWRQVEAWIEAGADLEAKFVSCATVEQHKH